MLLIPDINIDIPLQICKGDLYDSQKKFINKLQVVQNKAAKLVVNAGRLDSSTEITRLLHWLPVSQRM